MWHHSPGFPAGNCSHDVSMLNYSLPEVTSDLKFSILCSFTGSCSIKTWCGCWGWFLTMGCISSPSWWQRCSECTTLSGTWLFALGCPTLPPPFFKRWTKPNQTLLIALRCFYFYQEWSKKKKRERERDSFVTHNRSYNLELWLSSSSRHTEGHTDTVWVLFLCFRETWLTFSGPEAVWSSQHFSCCALPCRFIHLARTQI